MAAGASGSDGGIGVGRADAGPGQSEPTGQQSQPGAAGAGESQSEASDGIDALLEFFAPEQPAKPVEDDEGEDQIEGLSERAQKRIRNLSGRSKQLRQEMQGLQGKLGEYSQWSHQAYQTMQQQHAAMAAMRAELDALRAGYQSQPQYVEPEPTDDVGKFKKMLESELLTKANSQFAPQIQKALDAVERLNKEREAERRRYETQQRRQQYNVAVDRALEERLKPLMDSEVYESLKGHLGGVALSIASIRPDGDVGAATSTLVDILKNATRGIIKAHRGKVGQKVVESKQAPARTESGRSGTSKDVQPTMTQLRKAGFKNHLEWGMRGRPPLR